MSPAYSRTPESIEREIERTRQALDDTLDALQAKLSPRRRMEEAVDGARDVLQVAQEKGRRFAGQVERSVRRDPVPFIVAAGLLLALVVAGSLMSRR